MVKNDSLRQSARHHDSRRHRNNSRSADHGNVNSYIQESTRTDEQHKRHDEESPRKERGTKMTKRMKRTRKISGGLTMSILFLFFVGTSVSVAAATNRNQRRGEVRDNVRAEASQERVRFFDKQIRFEERDARAQACRDDRFQRELAIREFRAERRAENRTFNETELRFIKASRANRHDRQEDFTRIVREQNRLDNQFAGRAERSFVAASEGRFLKDFFLEIDRAYQRARVNG
jgi:hypothetical protein